MQNKWLFLKVVNKISILSHVVFPFSRSENTALFGAGKRGAGKEIAHLRNKTSVTFVVCRVHDQVWVVIKSKKKETKKKITNKT